MSAFSNNLKRLREERKWTQQQLAEMAQTSSAAISHYECGQREPNLSNLRSLQEALNCDYKEFFKP